MLLGRLDPGFEELLQIALERLLSRGLSIRREPVFKVPDSNVVLHLGFPNGDYNSQIWIDLVGPIVPAKDMQATSYSFIETARHDFDSVFRTICITTRYSAGSEAHSPTVSLRFFFAKRLTQS
jgi:hypothetical protein